MTRLVEKGENRVQARTQKNLPDDIREILSRAFSHTEFFEQLHGIADIYPGVVLARSGFCVQ